MMRRIGLEINDIMVQYPDIEICATFKMTDIILHFKPSTTTTTTTDDPRPDFKYVQIILKKNEYPFKVPEIIIRKKPYVEYLRNFSPRIEKIIRKYSNCLCCSSIVKKDNWVPSYKTINVLNEIKSMNEVKRTVKYILTLEDISKKYSLPRVLEYTIIEYLCTSNIIYMFDYFKYPL